ncbi:MAG: MerR family transcriptional regulator [Christensenellales bacterium]
MLIGQLMKKYGVTKKAVAYYQAQGLLHPRTDESGYRRYSQADAQTLENIVLLRRLGLPVPQIKEILTGKDPQAALSRAAGRARDALSLKEAQLRILDRLAQGLDFQAAKEAAKDIFGVNETLKEKLRLAFPGPFGRFLAVHFGAFLDVRVITGEQREAFGRITAFLDEVDFPRELEDFFAQTLDAPDEQALEALHCGQMQALEQAAGDPEAFIEKQKGFLQEYIDYRASEAFEASDAGKALRAMRTFQTQSGYTEIFIENMKILSPAYRDYTDRMQKAGDALLEQYPELEKLTKRI